MSLHPKSTQAILILIVSFILLSQHYRYQGIHSLHPSEALKIGGTFLFLYAAFAGALVGLAIRACNETLRCNPNTSKRFLKSRK